MNRLKHIIWVLFSVGFMLSCTDEDTITPEQNIDPKMSGTVQLNFTTPAAMDFTIARSSDISPDFLIQDLYIYVFSADGGNIVTLDENNQKRPIHYFQEELTNGITGAQEFKPNDKGGLYNANWIRFKIDESAFGSEVYIYLIANTSLYKEILSTSGTDLDLITQKDDLDKLVNIYQTNNIQLNRTNFMMSGHTDATQSRNKDGNVSAAILYITKDGTITRRVKDESGAVTSTSEASITLERSEAKIEFNFKSGTKGKFTPETFRIHNYPLKSYMMCQYYLQMSFSGINGEKIANKDASQLPEDFFNTETISINGDSFAFYMPETLKYPGKGNNGGTLLKAYSQSSKDGYKLREKHDKEGNWENAPTLATYVEIKGTYTGEATYNGIKKDVTAEVTYFIHLGFSLDSSSKYYVNDYYIRRNYKYIYNITVNGVTDIITEVNTLNGTANLNAAEGIVTWNEKISLTGTSPSSELIFYKNESLEIQYTDNEATEGWIQVKNKDDNTEVPMNLPLTKKLDHCIIKASSPLPEGTESRTATLTVTRNNGSTNSKTVKIFTITQKSK